MNRWALVVATICGAGVAHAQAPVDEPTVAAAEASEVRDRYCTDASAAAVTLEAEGTARVSAVWARVSRSYDASQASYLLYWRALLGQYIDKLDRVEADLEAFLAAVEGDPAYDEQARDARRRLQILSVRAKPGASPVDPRPALGLGVGLLAGGGVLAGVAGAQAAELAERDARWHSGELLTDAYEAEGAAADQAAIRTNLFVGSAIGAGVAGLVTTLVTLATGRDRLAPAVVLAPGGDGALLGLAGRW